MPLSHSPRGPRWWPLLVILALVVAALLVVWTRPSLHRQGQVEKTLQTAVWAYLLFGFWCLLLSRLRWKLRWLGVTIPILSVAVFVTLVQIDGVSGDLVPRVSWRFGSKDAAGELTSASIADFEPPRLDFPQFLGPQRNAVLNGVRLDPDWIRRPPEELWRRPMGSAWSGFAVVGRRAVTQEQRGEEEVVTCLDLETGAELWVHADPVAYLSKVAGDGPRATPTIADGRVLTLGSTGILNSLEFETGRSIWQRDILADHGAPLQDWGMSSSPLVHSGVVIVSAGGPGGHSLAAYDVQSGDIRWSAGDDPAGNSSPFLTVLDSVEQVLIFNHANLAAHDPSDGSLLWNQPWSVMTEHVAQPVPFGDNRILLSSGYGQGCRAYQITRDDSGVFRSEELWKSLHMKAKFTNLVIRGGFLYGLDDGRLACVDLADGSRRWKQERLGHGQLLLVDDVLLIQAESGEVVLVRADPHEFQVLARLPALRDMTWNSPTFAAPYLLVRNQTEAACFRLALLDP